MVHRHAHGPAGAKLAAERTAPLAQRVEQLRDGRWVGMRPLDRFAGRRERFAKASEIDQANRDRRLIAHEEDAPVARVARGNELEPELQPELYLIGVGHREAVSLAVRTDACVLELEAERTVDVVAQAQAVRKAVACATIGDDD